MNSSVFVMKMVGAVGAFALFFGPTSSFGQDAPSGEGAPSERLAESERSPHARSENHILPGWQLGVVGSASATFAAEEETDYEGGVGIMLDHFLVDNLLEIGGSVRLLQGMHTSLSFEILVDVPYHLNPHLEIYGGLGPVAIIAFEAENRFGLSLATGIHGWFNDRYGIVVEAAYSVLSGIETGHEIGISVGPIIEL